MRLTAWLVVLWVLALALWTVNPLLWLYVGSQVQRASGSLGPALLVMALGVAATIAGLLVAMRATVASYQQARVARGLEDTGGFPLEVALTCSAGIALVAFGVWFLGFSDAGVLPTPR